MSAILELHQGTSPVILAFPHQTLAARPDVKAELSRHYNDMDTFKGTLGDGEVWTVISASGPDQKGTFLL